MTNLRLKISTIELALTDGELFSASHFEIALVNGGELDIRITTPASPEVALVSAIVEGTGDGDIELFENGTISVGNAITPLDLNRVTDNAATTVIAEGPTVSAPGTSIFKGKMLGGQKNSAVPSDFTAQAALILKASEDYLLRVTNESGANSDYSVRIIFKEG